MRLNYFKLILINQFSTQLTIFLNYNQKANKILKYGRDSNTLQESALFHVSLTRGLGWWS